MKIFQIWQHPESQTESTVFGPRYLITWFSYLNFIVSCVYLIMNLRMHIAPLPNLIQIIGSLVTLIFLRLFRSQKPAAHVFLGMALLNACSLILTFVSFPYTILLWLPVFTIFSVYLVGTIAGGMWSFVGITCASLIVLFGTRFNAQPVPIAAADIPAIAVITLYLTGFSAFVGSLFFARSIKDLLLIQERQNEELKEQNKTIQLYAQDKAMLVAIVVHDIATPLTLILHGSDQAMRNPEDAPKYLGRIHKAARIIEEIARSVREFQSVESGKKSVEIGSVDLHGIFERASFIFEDRLREKNLTLEFDLPAEAHLQVLAEEKSLSNSVINNLISNAIKFSHPGQKIVITAQEDDANVTLSVQDFGVGMPENKARNIFSKNTTTSSKGTMGEKGTGFGLPISKAYMDKYGGEIRVQSTEQSANPHDHGTIFTLRLRRAHPDQDE